MDVPLSPPGGYREAWPAEAAAPRPSRATAQSQTPTSPLGMNSIMRMTASGVDDQVEPLGRAQDLGQRP